MNTLKWVRGVNGTLGWIAPKRVASKMRVHDATFAASS